MKNPLSGDGGWAIIWRITIIVAVAAGLITLMI